MVNIFVNETKKLISDWRLEVARPPKNGSSWAHMASRIASLELQVRSLNEARGTNR